MNIRSILRSAALALLALAALSLLSVAAQAHASLVSSDPKDGAVVMSAPSAFSLSFNEPVSALTLSLIRPDGSTLALDDFSLRDRTLEIAAPAELARGTHVLSWRVASQDGHPVGGSVVFSVGQPSAAPPAAAEAIDWTVRSGVWAGKVALYVGLFLGAGGAFAIAWMLRGERHARRLVLTALAVGAVGAVAAVGFQGLDALGTPVARIAEPLVWSTGMATSFGRTAVVAGMALVAAIIGAFAGGAVARLLSAVAVLLAATALALSGHASTAEPQWLMRSAVFLHAVGITLWAGALVPLAIALKRGSPQAVPGLRSFSSAIPYGVGLLAAAGVVLAVVQVQTSRALVDTAYGQVLLVKLALLSGLFLLAAMNRWYLTEAAAANEPLATQRLIRSITAETVIVLLVFGVAAAWRFTPPPRALAAAAARPASVHIHTAKAMADIMVMPGRAGPVEVVLTIMSGDFGPLDARQVSVAFTNPAAGIEPIRRPASKPGDGTWRVDGLVLPLAGNWKVRVDILISDFEMARLEGEVAIRP